MDQFMKTLLKIARSCKLFDAPIVVRSGVASFVQPSDDIFMQVPCTLPEGVYTPDSVQDWLSIGNMPKHCDWPVFDKPEGKGEPITHVVDLELLHRVAAFAPLKDIRYNITGVAFDLATGCMGATNGQVAAVSLPTWTCSNKAKIVRKAALRFLPSTGTASFVFYDNVVEMTCGDLIFMTTYIKNTYPDLARVIDSDLAFDFSVDLGELLPFAKMVKQGKTHPIPTVTVCKYGSVTHWGRVLGHVAVPPSSSYALDANYILMLHSATRAKTLSVQILGGGHASKVLAVASDIRCYSIGAGV